MVKLRIIEEKNEDILQSIRYAKRIQKAILPKVNIQNCPLDFHYIYEPKDVVSGDFYWFKDYRQHILFGLGDCTGHGVPGAMLATLSISLLNQLVVDFLKSNSAPSQNPRSIDSLFNQFDSQFAENLHQTFDYHAKDGLELGLFSYNLNTRLLQFVGANMDLWIIRNQEVIEIQGKKQSIEGWNLNHNSFTYQALLCQPNDFIVLFTDGIPDQFGGDNNKKFGYKKLREFFIEYLKPENSPNQLDWLEHKLKEWQGEHPQTDDRLCFVFKL